MNLPNYLIKHYTSNISTNISDFLAVGGGGSGKTTSLMEVYRRLCKTPHKTLDDKHIIPIFIHASKLVKNGVNTIQIYIVNNYLSLHENMDVDTMSINLKERILNKKSSKMHYIILIDALNENYNYKSMTEEIRLLSEMCNVSICLTFKGNPDALSLKNFTKLYFQNLDKKVVDIVIGNDKIDNKLKKLLQIPFYLEKYDEIRKNVNLSETCMTTAYEFLESYYQILIEKQFTNNEYILKENIKNVDEIKSSFYEIAPAIAFVLSRKKSSGDTFGGFSTSMMFTTADINLMNEINGIYAYNNSEIYLKLIRNIEYTVVSFLEPMGIIVHKNRTAKDVHVYYEFSHEFVRDFLCATYIKNCIINRVRITDKDYQNFPTDIIDSMLPQAMIHENCFIREDGSFNYEGFAPEMRNGLICCLEMFGMKSFDVNIPLGNLCFFTYVLLQSLHNNDKKKKLFCMSYIMMTSTVVGIINENSINSGRIHLNNTTLKLIHLHAEMLRRAEKYSKSIKTSDMVIALCQKGLENKKWQRYIDSEALMRHMRAAINNKCKVVIEEQYTFLKEGKSVDNERLIDAIGQLNDNDYPFSANLAAFLIYQPDPLIAPYMDIFCKKSKINNRNMYAFNKYRQSIIFSYIRESSMPGDWSYSLIKAIGFLLDNVVSVEPDEEGRIWLKPIERFISDETKFVPFDSNLCSESYKFACELIEELENTEASSSLYVLRVKYLLRTGCSDIIKILEYSKKVNYPFMNFVSSILENDNIMCIDNIRSRLIQLVDSRKYDAYDSIYVLKDMKEAWKVLKNIKTHTNNFTSAVDELLSTDVININ